VEWVEVTGRTVEAAKDAALDELGVDEGEAEFEVLEEPRPGLFGRLRSEARVRARVAPTAPRPKLDRRDRRRSQRSGGRSGSASGAGGGESSSSAGEGASPRGESEGATGGPGGAVARRSRSRRRKGSPGGPGPGGTRASGGPGGTRASGGPGAAEHDDGEDDVEYNTGEDGGDEVEVAEEFVTGLLETFGGSFTIERRPLEDDLVELSVQGDGLGLLIGPRGQTLAAVQELTRTVVQRRSRGRAGRILVDLAGYRQARRAALERFAGQVAEQVRASGVPRVLEPMPPADRKVVHDAINAIDGVTTSSEGEEPNRRVVISPQPSGEPRAGEGGVAAEAGAGSGD
jgi:spoIIIJ-associated protein